MTKESIDSSQMPPSAETLGGKFMDSFLNDKPFNTKEILTKLWKLQHNIDLPDNDPLVIYGTDLDKEAAQAGIKIAVINVSEARLDNEAIKVSAPLLTSLVIPPENKDDVKLMDQIQKDIPDFQGRIGKLDDDRNRLKKGYDDLLTRIRTKITEIVELYPKNKNIEWLEKEILPFSYEANTLAKEADAVRDEIKKLNSEQKSALKSIERIANAAQIRSLPEAATRRFPEPD